MGIAYLRVTGRGSHGFVPQPGGNVRILVPIKQVPETGDVRMDPETGTVVRAGVETVVNPLDLYAIEAALRLRESRGGTVTALTMGPPQALKALKEAVAMGCDDAVLVSDRSFGGSDTWATSYVLSRAVEAIGGADLIVAGERATDGDTAQVGPGLAAWLGLPLATYVSRVETVSDRSIVVERLAEDGYGIVELALPALLTVVKELATVRLPTLAGKKRARDLAIRVLDAASLDHDPASVGLKGSPTRVVRVESPKVTRGGRLVKASDDEAIVAAAADLALYLDERGLL